MYFGENDGITKIGKLIAGEERMSVHQGQATVCSLLCVLRRSPGYGGADRQ